MILESTKAKSLLWAIQSTLQYYERMLKESRIQIPSLCQRTCHQCPTTAQIGAPGSTVQALERKVRSLAHLIYTKSGNSMMKQVELISCQQILSKHTEGRLVSTFDFALICSTNLKSRWSAQLIRGGSRYTLTAISVSNQSIRTTLVASLTKLFFRVQWPQINMTQLDTYPGCTCRR